MIQITKINNSGRFITMGGRQCSLIYHNFLIKFTISVNKTLR